MTSIMEFFWHDVSATIVKDQQERFAKGGIGNKTISVLEGVGGRLYNLLQGLFLIPDTLYDVGRIIVAPFRILADGGLHWSTAERTAKAVASIGAKLLLNPVVYLGSVIVPELTFGVFHLDETIVRLGMIHKMQTASSVHDTAMGKVFSKYGSEMRAQGTENALKQPGLLVSKGQSGHYMGQALWERAKQELPRDVKSLAGRVSLWNEVVHTIDDVFQEEKAREILMRQIWLHKQKLEEEYPELKLPQTQKLGCKLAIFRTLCQDMEQDKEGVHFVLKITDTNTKSTEKISIPLPFYDGYEGYLSQLYAQFSNLRAKASLIEGCIKEEKLPDDVSLRESLKEFNKIYDALERHANIGSAWWVADNLRVPEFVKTSPEPK